MNQENVPTNENNAAASTAVPEDCALDALVTGKRAFRKMSRTLFEARLGDHPERAEEFVDSYAQELARNLERYLSSWPPEFRIMLAGEVFRSLLYESMLDDFPEEPKELVPMTTHAKQSLVFHRTAMGRGKTAARVAQVPQRRFPSKR